MTKFSKDLLQELYAQKLMSSTKIAEKFFVSQRTVINYLKKYSIPTRPSGPIPSPKVPPPNDVVEMSYMLGLCASDVYAGRHYRQVKVQLGTSVQHMVEVFKQTWGHYAPVRIYPTKNKFSDNVVTCYCLLHPNFSFLVDEKKSVPEDLMSFYAYLAGAIDGDGSIRYDPSRHMRAIRLHNTDKAWLNAIKNQLNSLGICPTIQGKERYFTLYIYRRNDVLKLGPVLIKFMKYEPRKNVLEKMLTEMTSIKIRLLFHLSSFPDF